MKKVLFLFISALMAVLFSGCAGKQVEPYPVYSVTTVEDKQFTSVLLHKQKASAIQKMAVALKTTAKKFNDKGYNYFYLERTLFPTFLTDIKSVDNYCFPENNGFHIGDTKKTSLEGEKCKLEENTNGKKKFLMTFIPLKEPLINQPTWSVKQVLNDNNIDKYIEAMLEDGEYEIKKIKETRDLKEYDNAIK